MFIVSCIYRLIHPIQGCRAGEGVHPKKVSRDPDTKRQSITLTFAPMANLESAVIQTSACLCTLGGSQST